MIYAYAAPRLSTCDDTCDDTCDECKDALPTKPQEGRFLNYSSMQEPFMSSKRRMNQMVFSRLRAKVEGRATTYCILLMLSL